MKRSVTFPMRLTSENKKRCLDMRAAMAVAAATKRERNEMALYLASLPKPPHYLAPTQPGGPPPANRITVTITRISPGVLDDDNLRGACKAVRDGTADWLGLKDNDARIEWSYGQQGCPLKQFGARVDIEDLSAGADVVRILGNVPTRLTNTPSEGKARRLPEPPPREQQLVFTRPCLVSAPWHEAGTAVEVNISGEPPESIRMRVPANALTSSLCRLRPGTLVELHRTEDTDEELGPVWLYQARAIRSTTCGAAQALAGERT